MNWEPAPEEGVPVVRPAEPVALTRGVPFRVVSWNIQFAGTRRHRFFYDGGRAVHVPPADVAWALENIAAVLAAAAPDITLLQEVDRDSRRTGRVDELAALVAAQAPATWMSAPYHWSRFVPHPPYDPLGRIAMHLALLSRFGLAHGRRIDLPRLAEPALRRAFNLKRAVLTAEVPIAGGGPPLAVATTHLSAFSRGDGTLPRQVAVLEAWMEARRQAGQSFVLGGDLNLLPPGDDGARLGADAVEYADAVPPIHRLLPRFRSAIPIDQLGAQAARTYFPPGAVVPDRVLDYLFVSDDLEVHAAGPIAAPALLSDHLPLLATLGLPR